MKIEALQWEEKHISECRPRTRFTHRHTGVQAVSCICQSYLTCISLQVSKNILWNWKKRNFLRLLQSIYRQCVLWACSYTHASPKYTQGHTCTRFRHPYAQLPAFPALTNTFTPLLKCASSWSSCGNTPQKLMNLQYDLMSNLSEDAPRLHTSALTLHQTSKSSELKHTGAGNKDRTIHSRSLQIFQYSTGKLLQPYVSIILAKRSKND